MDSNNKRKRRINHKYPNCYWLFVLLAALILAGTITQADGQQVLFELVTLKPAYDETFANDIQHILESYHWSNPYTTGNFSCTDTSMYIVLLLERYGYRASCMTDWGPDNRSLNDDPVGHMWVAVNNPRHNESWIFIDGNGGFYPDKKPLPNSIGQIIYGDIYRTGYIISNPLEYLAKYDSNPRQSWRQQYSLNDSNAPKPNTP